MKGVFEEVFCFRHVVFGVGQAGVVEVGVAAERNVFWSPSRAREQ